jgi:hypothetical protein
MSLRSAPSVILSAAKELAHRDPSLRSGRPQTAVYAKRFPTWLAREEKFIASRKSFAPQISLGMTITKTQDSRTQP